MGSGGDSTLSELNISNPIFTPDKKGDYVIGLVVNDGQIDSAEDTMKIHVINNQPIAEAGPHLEAHISSLTVTLDGSASFDPDGDTLAYSWRIISKPAGSTAVIVNPHSVTPTFTIDKATGEETDYIFGLVVNDGYMDSAEDTVTVTLVEHAPVANAGSPQSGHVAYASRPMVFTLNSGGSTDPDGDPIVGWTWRVVSGSASISDIHTANPTVSMSSPGSAVIGLVVSDGWLPSTEDTVTLTYTNVAPTANAGSNQSGHVAYASRPIIFTMDSSASSDPDSDPIVGYTWSVVSGSASISDIHAANPTVSMSAPGSAVIGLVVSDGFANSTQSTVTVTYTNQAPTANAGSYSPVLYANKNNVALSGSGSDPDGDPYTYSWVQTGGPAVTLNNANTATPWFDMATPGTYTFRLDVSDGFATGTSTATVTNSSATYFTGWEGGSWNDSRGVAWTTDTDNTNIHAPNTNRPRTGSYSYRVEAKSAPFPYTNKYWDNRIRSTFSPSVYVISVTLYTSYSTVSLCGNATLTLYKDGASLATIGSGTGWTTYTRAINAVTSSIGLHTNVCSNVSGKSNAYWDDISIQVWN
jgi:hypothetical protein